MSYRNFNEHFWGPNGGEVIEKRLNQGSESSKLFAYFMEERSAIEETYSKGLLKLLKNTANLTEFGTLRDSWLSIRGETENLAKIHHDLSVTLHKDLGQSLNKFKDEQLKLRRQYIADCWKLNKERRGLEQNIYKLKDKYEEFAKKAEQSQSQVDVAKSQNKSQADVAKLTLKAQKYAKEEMMFEHEYKESIMKLGTFQPTWEEKISAIYQILQTQEEERIEFLKTLLDKFVGTLEVGAPYLGDACKRMKDTIRAIDKNEDIMCFIRENQTGTDKPIVPPFIPHNRAGRDSTPVTLTSSSVSSPAFSSPATSSTPKQISSLSGASSTSSPAAGTPKFGSPAATPTFSKKPAPAPAPRQKKARALYDYVGADANELDFFANDTITVLEEDASGWWTGEIDGRKGLFPSNYVEVI